jgi:hypothetical protein
MLLRERICIYYENCSKSFKGEGKGERNVLLGIAEVNCISSRLMKLNVDSWCNDADWTTPKCV